jgi:photosystem II stability/assembly factor-like uncharacterized protein
MSKLSLAVFLMVASATITFAQTIHQPRLTPQNSNTTQLLISVSPVSDRVVWAAGTHGTYVVTTDGGNTWRAGTVPGAQFLQFRDVQGVSDQIAYLMSIGNGTEAFRIYKTEDGGATWKVQFTNKTPNAFYDCFAFWTPDRGITHSDSVNGVFHDIRTHLRKYAPSVVRRSLVLRERYLHRHRGYGQRLDYYRRFVNRANPSHH